MSFSNLKIGTRLGVSFAAVAVFSIVLGGAAYKSLENINNSWKLFSTQILAKEDAVRQGLNGLSEGVQNFKNYVVRERDYDRQFSASMNDIDAAMTAYEKTGTLTQLERELVSEVRISTTAYRKALAQAVAMKSDGVSIQEIDGAIKGADKALKAALLKLEECNIQDISTVGATVTQNINRGETIALIGSLIVLIMTGVLSVAASRSITRPIYGAVETARLVSTGDLSHRIEQSSTDETGQLLGALSQMTSNLGRIVLQVRTSSEILRVAAGEIASGNLDLSTRTEEQAGSLEETASAVEELTATVKQNADNAKHAKKLADSASIIAVNGGQTVASVVATMGAINASSKKIVDIISVIDGIAFQTNILALNAAVEAARAGEQGRGFAVVASEVRALAQRSASAAKEIKELITDAVDKVESGTTLVDSAGATMTDVVSSIQGLAGIMSEISAASEEQTIGIEQINQSISAMDQATQQNAALVEEAAAASSSMEQQAELLAAAVTVFKLSHQAENSLGSHIAMPHAVHAIETHDKRQNQLYAGGSRIGISRRTRAI